MAQHVHGSCCEAHSQPQRVPQRDWKRKLSPEEILTYVGEGSIVKARPRPHNQLMQALQVAREARLKVTKLAEVPDQDVEVSVAWRGQPLLPFPSRLAPGLASCNGLFWPE